MCNKNHICTKNEKVQGQTTGRPKNEAKVESLLKKKKAEQNKKYRSKYQAQRKTSTELDSQIKQKEREWKRKSRQKKAKAESEKVNDENCLTITINKEQTPAGIRKQAERARSHLPESLCAWANTISHIISNATPWKKALFVSEECTFLSLDCLITKKMQLMPKNQKYFFDICQKRLYPE